MWRLLDMSEKIMIKLYNKHFSSSNRNNDHTDKNELASAMISNNNKTTATNKMRMTAVTPRMTISEDDRSMSNNNHAHVNNEAHPKPSIASSLQYKLNKRPLTTTNNNNNNNNNAMYTPLTKRLCLDTENNSYSQNSSSVHHYHNNSQLSQFSVAHDEVEEV